MDYFPSFLCKIKFERFWFSADFFCKDSNGVTLGELHDKIAKENIFFREIFKKRKEIPKKKPGVSPKWSFGIISLKFSETFEIFMK